MIMVTGIERGGFLGFVKLYGKQFRVGPLEGHSQRFIFGKLSVSASVFAGNCPFVQKSRWSPFDYLLSG